MTHTELANKHMMAHHELNRCRGNAVAFSLMAEMSETDEAKASNLGCVAYWDAQVEQTKARIAALDQAIAAQAERDRNTRTHYASMSRAARRRFLDD